ncbi:MAG: hypothetical protein ABSC08_20115 [Bryobacteraceae bacterium]|jgi:predicted ABC-type transport system involved in lysophospholipase L1 biosynthesis ATPase subunit
MSNNINNTYNVMIALRLEAANEMDALQIAHELLLARGVRAGHAHTWIEMSASLPTSGANLDAAFEDEPQASLADAFED